MPHHTHSLSRTAAVIVAAFTAMMLTAASASAATADSWRDKRGDVQHERSHRLNRSIDIYSVKASSRTRNGTRYAIASWRLRDVHRADAPGAQWLALAFKYGGKHFVLSTANGRAYLDREQADGTGYYRVSCDGDVARLAPGSANERAWASVPVRCLARVTGGHRQSGWNIVMTTGAWLPYGFDGEVHSRDRRRNITQWLRWRWA